jgi:MoxR-like ATPase
MDQIRVFRAAYDAGFGLDQKSQGRLLEAVDRQLDEITRLRVALARAESRAKETRIQLDAVRECLLSERAIHQRAEDEVKRLSGLLKEDVAARAK